jgi:hypothetical protein
VALFATGVVGELQQAFADNIITPPTLKEDNPMRELRDKEMAGWTIIEHRDDENVVGQVEYNGLNGDSSFGVGWHHHDGGNRTTLFRPSSWRCEVVANVVFMHRTGEDTDLSDNPWRTANLYTLVQSSRR